VPPGLAAPKQAQPVKPWKPPRGGAKGHGSGKSKKAQLPQAMKLPKVEKPKVTVPKVTVPKVNVPPPAPAAPVKAVDAAPATPVAHTPSAAQQAPSASPRRGRSAPKRSRGAQPSLRGASSRRVSRPTRGGASKRSAPRRHRAAAHAAASRPRKHAAPPRHHAAHASSPDRGSAVTRTVRDIVEVVPGSIKATLAALACLCAVLGGGYLMSLIRARRLSHQRGELLQEVGLLQAALLPSVPDTLGSVRPSVAYRPAEGLAAGGDFYDALDLPGGRAGFILGDVSGHGREALERTAFARYTLRAFLEAGLEPRVALQVAARVLGEHLGGEFVTVLLAVHDPADGSLTWASAGHPAPIVLGSERFEPVTAGSSPPIGMGLDTGLRQTTVPLPAGSIACMYTDGLVEARTDGDFMGRRGLEEILGELGDAANAAALIELVAARSGTASDDMAACLLTPAGQTHASAARCEELVVTPGDVERGVVGRFLEACGVERTDVVLDEAADVVAGHDGAVLSVIFGATRSVEISPREAFDEERAEASSRRIAAA
jgi:hypothetical protein